VGSLRFRRTKQLAPGVRLNLNKRSVGLTFGPRGARYTANTAGRRTTSVGIPGTGLYYRDERGGGRSTFGDDPLREAARTRGFWEGIGVGIVLILALIAITWIVILAIRFWYVTAIAGIALVALGVSKFVRTVTERKRVHKEWERADVQRDAVRAARLAAKQADQQ
jgi:hypothetical protein